MRLRRVDAVKHGTRDAFLVAGYRLMGASTGFNKASVKATWARIHRGNA